MIKFQMFVNILDIILAFGKCILDFVLFFWFSNQFFNCRYNKNKIFPCIVLTVLTVNLYLTNFLHIPLLNTMTALACALVINFLLFKGSVTARLLCSIAEVLLIVICEFIPISIYSLICRNDIASITNMTIKNAGFNLIGTGIFSVIIILTHYFIILKRKRSRKNISITENLSIAVVPIVSMCVIYYILDMSCVNADNTHDWNSIFVFLGLLLMNIMVITGDNTLRKRYQLQQELDKLNRQENLNKIVISQQDQFIEELKGFEHDYKKQVEGLKNILRKEGIDNLKKDEFQVYEEEMYKNLEEHYRFAFIPTPALRSILSQIQLRCNVADITFDIDLQYANFSFVAFPDLYSIFENPLDNAVIACSKIQSKDLPKKIQLTILRKKNLIWIEIKNTKANPIITQNDCIQTTKTDHDWHGIGIKNIKHTIKKYNGYLNIDYTENEFSIVMVLPALKD